MVSVFKDRSLLPVVMAADNFPSSPLNDPYPVYNPDNGDKYIPFHLTFDDHHKLPPVGMIRPSVLAAMQEDERDPAICPWQFHSNAIEGEDDTLELSVQCVFLADWVLEGGRSLITQVMQQTAERWRAEGRFPSELNGWRDEQYNIYAHPESSGFKRGTFDVADGTPTNVAFALERSACVLFGVATYGVHLTAYEGEGEDMKIWVPRRSRTKQTFPGMLDNSVAGGIPRGMNPFEAIVKECEEEANLPEQHVRPRIRAVGIATYLHVVKAGFFQPEIQSASDFAKLIGPADARYIYDLALPHNSSPDYIQPCPNDGEVESFVLWTIPEVVEAMHKGEFKPNCGLILVDFLIRHGFVTPENEPNLIEISCRIHRRLQVAVRC
ncbi:NUDIX hydrolase domain-like protein [Papiliotrema laurentii]|uniref:NUDIX hydrolase domain-like protein n=1 Tax=Papiliotrema laurentii TaxID=5418 RepID=A0AAD9FU69_PAPLA|nr:NUDIX hydrolase domain-like protein [Papiliotrema laurentii]